MRDAGGRRRRRRFSCASFAVPLMASVTISVAISFAHAGAAPDNALLLQADDVTYDGKNRVVTARGNVQVMNDDRQLVADIVTYDEIADKVIATGHVSVREPDGSVAFADHVELSQGLREGALQGLAALIGENGRLAAASGERREGRFTVARAAVFTPCAVCEEEENPEPLWQIRAGRVIHDQVEKRIYFDDATFEFMGVPVFYLPFFSQADPTVRHKSGFLLPDFGSSSTLGAFLKVPYYVSLDPSRDLTLSPYLTGNAGNVMQAEFSQRFEGGGFWLQGSLGYDDDAQNKPGQSVWFSHLFGSGRMSLNDTWRTGFDVQLTSKDSYLQRYELSYLDRLTTNLFVERVSGRNRLALTGFFFQSLRAGDITGQIPMALPLVEATYIPEEKIAGGRLRVDGSALALSRDIGTDMVRGSAAVNFRRPFVADSGQLFTFQAIGRGDVYHLNDAKFSAPLAAHNTETISRALGLAMLEWRWPFVREMGIGDTNLVLEPIMQLVAASNGGNPRGMPNEDSTSVEFDATNLFSPNQMPGLDLWTGGPRSNVGVRATAILPQATVEATLGQELRFQPDRNLPPALGLTGDKSDIVGQFKIDMPQGLSITHQFNIDPAGGGSLRRNEVYIKAQLGRSSINLSYQKLPVTAADPTLGEQEQVFLDTTVFVTENWAVFAGARRDIAKSQMLESSIGLRYEDECFIASLGFHRRDTATLNLKPASAVIFRLGFKTGLTGG